MQPARSGGKRVAAPLVGTTARGILSYVAWACEARWSAACCPHHSRGASREELGRLRECGLAGASCWSRSTPPGRPQGSPTSTRRAARTIRAAASAHPFPALPGHRETRRRAYRAGGAREVQASTVTAGGSSCRTSCTIPLIRGRAGQIADEAQSPTARRRTGRPPGRANYNSDEMRLMGASAWPDADVGIPIPPNGRMVGTRRGGATELGACGERRHISPSTVPSCTACATASARAATRSPKAGSLPTVHGLGCGAGILDCQAALLVGSRGGVGAERGATVRRDLVEGAIGALAMARRSPRDGPRLSRDPPEASEDKPGRRRVRAELAATTVTSWSPHIQRSNVCTFGRVLRRQGKARRTHRHSQDSALLDEDPAPAPPGPRSPPRDGGLHAVGIHGGRSATTALAEGSQGRGGRGGRNIPCTATRHGGPSDAGDPAGRGLGAARGGARSESGTAARCSRRSAGADLAEKLTVGRWWRDRGCHAAGCVAGQ